MCLTRIRLVFLSIQRPEPRHCGLAGVCRRSGRNSNASTVGSDFSSKSGRVLPKRVTSCPRSRRARLRVRASRRRSPRPAARPRERIPQRAKGGSRASEHLRRARRRSRSSRSLPSERHALPPPATQSPGQTRREAIAIVIARQAAAGNLAAFRRNPTMRTVSARPATCCCPNVPAVGRRSADFARMSADTRQTGAGAWDTVAGSPSCATPVVARVLPLQAMWVIARRRGPRKAASVAGDGAGQRS